MRIFAKRGRKASSSPKDKEAIQVFQSDPVAEELLKQDPSTWSSKQRRMVKRYQDRKKEDASSRSDGEGNVAVEKNETVVDHSDAEAKDDESTRDMDDKKPEPIIEIESSGSSSESDKDEAEDDQVKEESHGVDGVHDNDDEAEEEMVGGDGSDVGAEVEKDEQQGAQSVDSATPPDESKGEIESTSQKDQLEELLNQLNSKERRKIARKIERNEATMDEAIEEAKGLLTEKATSEKQLIAETSEAPKVEKITDSSSKKRGGEEDGAEEDGPKKRQKKGPVDLSSLPAEERLRREEQRRLQREAAERRQRGQVSIKHRHPLNSERRRANKRKPKWLKRPVAKLS